MPPVAVVMAIRERLRAYLELTRPFNAVAAGGLTGIGAFVGGASTATLPAVVAAIGATVFATAAGNAVNDYFDRDVDAINDPDRPIPRGAVQPSNALVISLVFFGGAIGLAITLPPLALAIALLNLFALLGYTELFKGKPGAGNALVAYLVGSTFLFGGAAVGAVTPTVILFLLAALSTLSREIIKDVEDVAGDRAEGVNTLPVVIGSNRATWVAVGILVVAVIASPVPYLLSLFGIAYLLVVIPADGLMLWAAARSFANPGQGHRVLKYGMVVAAMAFVIGRVVGSVSF